MVDAMDFMLYAMAIGHLRAYFGFDDATAGLAGTVTLAMSAIGGVVFGVVADRFGRTRAMMATILIFSFASLGAATSATFVQLLLLARAARPRHGRRMGDRRGARERDVSRPNIATRQSASCSPAGRWATFSPPCSPPSCSATQRSDPTRGAGSSSSASCRPSSRSGSGRRVREPDAWIRTRAHAGTRRNAFSVIFGRELRRRTILVILLGSCVQFAYWGIFFWLPGFLARPVADGGAGMGVVRSLGWIIPVQIGAYFGYLTFGFIADRIGRRRAFILFMLAAAVLVAIYGQLAAHPWWLLALSPVLGYVGHGYFSMFGSFIAELFPAAVRATGQGLTYNAGRLAGAFAPFVIGALADVPRLGHWTGDRIDVGVLSGRGVTGADVTGPEWTGVWRSRGGVPFAIGYLLFAIC